MDANDRRAIEHLFAKLEEVERRAPPRDSEAEAFIRSAVERSPAAPYYMAQTIVVQQQALEEAQRRIADLEGAAPGNEGFLSGLFGGGRATPPSRQPARSDQPRPAAGPWSRGYGGGFLAGAAQTAMGVAGGILLGNLIAGAFAGGSDAEAADNDRSADRGEAGEERATSGDDAGTDDGGTDFADAGGDFGGDF